ncbi:VOC family protein [Mycobacterium sp. NPDC050551]|uniref:VOC family protein n=1 Tax=Mycobacterium sp. NPDC050551 TaxID=3155407 RepID=UPI00341ED62E
MPHLIRHILVESADPAALLQFWSALLDLPVVDDEAVTLGDGAALRFAATAESKRVKNRLHLDLASMSAEHQADLVRTARGLGAQPVDVGQSDVPWVVLADPGGNEFCVLEPREVYRGVGPVAAVVIDALDPPAQAEVWAGLTGLPVTRSHPQYASLRQEGRFWVEFIRVDTPKTVRNRVHLVLAADDADLPQTDPEGNEILT